jgi:pimeloyl-ACP methyl ester carboxylesterase
MKAILLIGLTGLLLSSQTDKHKVTFTSSDGLIITADIYIADKELPYILLFHQEGSSRGEYIEIAEKLTKLNYNCLAVDLRSGENSNYINNETALQAAEKGVSDRMIDARLDIKAAIDYAWNLSYKPIILFGSSYSASLCLLEGRTDDRVKSVIAFSPGEFFGDDIRIQDEMTSFDKPLFVATTQRENPYVVEMLGKINQENITWFQPADSPGIHGSKALWESSTSKDQYWLALILFFNSLR